LIYRVDRPYGPDRFHGPAGPTLPDRAAHARQAKLSHLEFLELLLQDEIDRRNSRGLQQRIAVAGFEEEVTLSPSPGIPPSATTAPVSASSSAPTGSPSRGTI
jgi:hypothetical protein